MIKRKLRRTVSNRPGTTSQHIQPEGKEKLTATDSLPVIGCRPPRKSDKWNDWRKNISESQCYGERNIAISKLPQTSDRLPFNVLVTDTNEGTTISSNAEQNSIHLGNQKLSVSRSPPQASTSKQYSTGTIKKTSFASCPNLLRNQSIPIIQPLPLQKSVSYELPKGTRRQELSTDRTSSKLLNVPNLFVTSFTHSSSSEGSLSIGHSKSAPTLGIAQHRIGFERKHTLVKSLSSGPSVSCPQDPLRVNDIEEITLREHFRNAHMSQILDYLFVGSIESAYNERLLCQFNITSVVDMSNKLPEDVPSERKQDSPCLCSNVVKHSKARLCIGVDESDSENLENYFEDINKFIEGARKNGRSVLLHCYHGNCRAPAAAIQYLMTNCAMSLRRAFFLVKKHRPTVELRKDVQCVLQRLELKLNPTLTTSLDFNNDTLSFAVGTRKTAWSECSDS